MKKTVVSVATLTALTGVAATAVSADEYKVSSGDTLWGIANEVGTSVTQLKEENKLNNDLIHPGDVLTLNAEEVEAPAPVNENHTYTVKSGDTLSQIGEEFSLDYKEIMKLNNLNSDLIFVGQVLIISNDAPQEEVAVATEEVTVDEVAEQETSDQTTEEVVTEEVTVEESTEEVAAAEQAEADRVAAEEQAQEVAAAQKAAEEAEAERVAAEEQAKEAAAAQEAAEQAEAERVAAEQKAQEEAAAQAAAEQAEAERVAAEEAAVAEAEAAERAAEQAAASQPSASTPSQSVSNGKNWYDWGTCAWYVFERRSDMGLSTGNGWGDASNWASAAQSSGYSVGNTPEVGAVMHAPAYTNGSYGQGHVAVVERVNGDGSILVSEMQFGGGVGDKNTRTLSASQASSHNFIY